MEWGGLRFRSQGRGFKSHGLLDHLSLGLRVAKKKKKEKKKKRSYPFMFGMKPSMRTRSKVRVARSQVEGSCSFAEGLREESSSDEGSRKGTRAEAPDDWREGARASHVPWIFESACFTLQGLRCRV